MEIAVSSSFGIWSQVRPVLLGLVFVVLLSSAADAACHALGIFPPVGEVMSGGLFALAVAYRTAFGIGGSYLAARVAPSHRLRHALILGAIGTLAALAGALATWDRGPEFGPHWYPLTLVITALPNAWLGGRLAK